MACVFARSGRHEPGGLRHIEAGAAQPVFPPSRRRTWASAISDTIGETVVTRESLDLRLAELRADIGRDLAATKADILKWMFGTVGFQTLTIIGGLTALFRLFG